MTRDISGRLYVWKYSWPSTELHCGAIKLDWNDNVVASLKNWKSTQCEAANTKAQHRKTQEWQLLAYSLKQQLISLGKKWPPITFQGLYFSHFGWKPNTPQLHHHPRPCFPVVWPLLRRALPSLRGPHYNMKANKLAVRSFLQLLTGCKASVL